MLDPEERFDRYLPRIRRRIIETPGITSTELKRATNLLKESERNNIIAFLITEGEIRKEVTRTAGRPKVSYWPISLQQQGWAEYDRVYDLANMTQEQIRAANERRIALNRVLVEGGFDLLTMLRKPR